LRNLTNESPFVVPFRKPALIGRDDLLRPLHTHIETTSNNLIPAITGAPGVGKTQFAALYIHTYRAAFPGGVFWLDLAHSRPVNILRQIGGSFARAYGLTSQIADPIERDRDLSEQWLGRVRNDTSVLLVADSVGDAESLAELPGLTNSDLKSLDCKIVVTTRLRGLPGCTDFHLDPLSSDASYRLLLSESGTQHQQVNEEEKRALNDVFSKLGGLPLTLRLAGALVREEQISFEDVAAALEETGVIDVFDTPTIALEDYQTNVCRALSRLITDSLGTKSPNQSELFHVLKVISCFPENAILRWDFLRHFVRLQPGRFKGGDRFARVIGDLHRRNLIDEPGKARSSIRIHNLIHEYARRFVDNEFLHDVVCYGTTSILDEDHLFSLEAGQYPYLARDISLVVEATRGAANKLKIELLASFQKAIERQTNHLRENCDALQQLHSQTVADRATRLAEILQKALQLRNQPRLLTVWSTSGTAPSLIRTFRGHNDWIRSCSFDAIGRRALSASSDRTLILWNVETGDVIRKLVGHSAAVFSHSFSGPNDNAISASLDRTVILWDLSEGSIARILCADNRSIMHCSTSAEGSRALSASENRYLVLWDLSSGTKINEVLAPENWSSTCMLLPDGKRALVGTESGECIVIDMNSGETIISPRHHNSSITSLSVSENSGSMLTAAADGTLAIWDVSNGNLKHYLRNKEQRVLACAIDANANVALATFADGSMASWDLKTQSRIRCDHGHQGPILSCSVSRDGTRALSGSTDGSLILWDLKNRGAVGERIGHRGTIWSCTLSTDGKRALSGGNDGVIRYWDTGSGLVIRELIAEDEPIHECALDVEGKLAVTASASGRLRRWNLETGSLTNELLAHQGPVRAIAVSVDGKHVVSSGSDHTTVLWSIDQGHHQTLLSKQSSIVRSCAFNASTTRLVMGLSDGLILLWDFALRAPIGTLRGHAGDVISCTFAENDQFILSASSDGCIRRWSVNEEQPPVIFDLPESTVNNCRFGSNSHLALTTSNFRTIRVWNFSKQEAVSSLSLNSLTSFSLSADGSSLVVGDGKGDLSFLNIEI
jgi:WD40 repeat protein